MLGPIGCDIMAIFRLLSPTEIDRYIEVHKESKVSMPMAANGQALSFDQDEPHLENKGPKKKFNPKNKAKIVNINKYKKEREAEPTREESSSNRIRAQNLAPPDNEESSPPRGNNALESIGVLSASTIKNIENERMKKEKQKEDSATVFLLKERQKLRDSKKKLIKQEAFKTYQTSSTQVYNSSSSTDEEGESEASDTTESRGILVNKRHY